MTWVMKTERNPSHSTRGGTRTMRGKSPVFYLGNGKIPCDKFCRIIRRKKNDSIYHFHSMLCMCEYQNILLKVLQKPFCVLVPVVKCILFLLLSGVTCVCESERLNYLFRVIQWVMVKLLIELREIILDWLGSVSIFTIDLKRTGLNTKYLDQGIQNQTSIHQYTAGGGFCLFCGFFYVALFCFLALTASTEMKIWLQWIIHVL